MKSKLLVLVLAALGVAFVYNFVLSWPVDVNAQTTGAPEDAVEMFYTWYLDYARADAAGERHNPIVDEIYRDSALLTEVMISRVDEMAQNLHADPFLCAQDFPQSISVELLASSDDTAVVSLFGQYQSGPERYDTMPLASVNLQLVGGQWKFSKIECGR